MGTNYDDDCAFYDNLCKLKCEKVIGDDDTCKERPNDCLLILSNSSKNVNSNTCINKV
jgi:hypothetical protein